MSANALDQIVKGASPSSFKALPPTPLLNISSASTPAERDHDNDNDNGGNHNNDPLSYLPSSPPQIYLNLLILESSLRAQYLQLLSRRRLHTFFVLLLSLWTGSFTYLLFLRPREDGLGLGGSVYWVVETMEKVALMGGAVTMVLFWGTGQWERGIRWPRRWVGTTNRGLRGFNLRVVVLRGPWWQEWPKHLAFLFPTMNLQTSGGEWHMVEYSSGQHGGRNQHPHHRHGGPGTGMNHPDLEDQASVGGSSSSSGGVVGLIEEDVAPGGDYIRLLLLPKSFSPEFRQNWEAYRADYWERENERRALLRQKSRSQRRARAKHHGGWMWWTGLWRVVMSKRRYDLRSQLHLTPNRGIPGSPGHARSRSNSSRRSSSRRRDVEKQPHNQNSIRSPSFLSWSDRDTKPSLSSPVASSRPRRKSLLRSESSTTTTTTTNNNNNNTHHPSSRHSSRRNSSTRSTTTTTPMLDDKKATKQSRRHRRGSSASTSTSSSAGAGANSGGNSLTAGLGLGSGFGLGLGLTEGDSGISNVPSKTTTTASSSSRRKRPGMSPLTKAGTMTPASTAGDGGGGGSGGGGEEEKEDDDAAAVAGTTTSTLSQKDEVATRTP